VQIELDRWRLQDLEAGFLLHFPTGLLGFPYHKTYRIQVQHPDMPFRWLQATDGPPVAFAITDPFTFLPGYQVSIQEQDVHDLQVTAAAELLLFVIVTLPRQTSLQLTVNLQGPVLVNRVNGWAKQLVLVQGPYHTCHPLRVTSQAPSLAPSP
jgi:flagellar assembly factor FliW